MLALASAGGRRWGQTAGVQNPHSLNGEHSERETESEDSLTILLAYLHPRDVRQTRRLKFGKFAQNFAPHTRTPLWRETESREHFQTKTFVLPVRGRANDFRSEFPHSMAASAPNFCSERGATELNWRTAQINPTCVPSHQQLGPLLPATASMME
jgi:hypothetical protein